MFADTDFILALLKDSDWLKKNALNLLQKHKDDVSTSVSVMIEVSLVCKRLKLNVQEIFANALEIIKVDDKDYDVCMKASAYIERYGLNAFDSFHAACCGDDVMISSDSAYDELGLQRVNLESLGEKV